MMMEISRYWILIQRAGGGCEPVSPIVKYTLELQAEPDVACPG